MSNDLQEEADEDACRTIAHFATKPDRRPEISTQVRPFLVQDLAWKIRKLGAFPRAVILHRSWYDLVAREIRPPLPESFFPKTADPIITATPSKRRVDVGLLTVIGCELKAALLALGFQPDRPPDETIRDRPYWFAELTGAVGQSINVALTIVGEPRNVPCAIAVEGMIQAFDPPMIVLAGIAAGPRGHVKLGDVVYAQRVYDYEHVRLELRRFFGIPSFLRKPRPLYIEVPQPVKIALQRLDQKIITELFSEVIQNCADHEQLPDGALEHEPTLHDGTIAAGEKLFADGSLRKMCRDVDQRIRACDQEDSGFAQACEPKKINWAVFRGICDFGDPKKGGAWQFTAALAAVITAMTFIRTSWPATVLSAPEKSSSSSGIS